MTVAVAPMVSMKSFATVIAVLLPSMFLYVVVFGFLNDLSSMRSIKSAKAERRKAEVSLYNLGELQKKQSMERGQQHSTTVYDLTGLTDSFSGRALRTAVEQEALDMEELIRKKRLLKKVKKI